MITIPRGFMIARVGRLCFIANLRDDMHDRARMSSPDGEAESPQLPVMNLSPQRPISSDSDKPTNRRTRQYQTTLEELFPIQQPSSAKKRKRVVDSESDSDFDQMQPEQEHESSDSETEFQHSDAEEQESEAEDKELETRDQVSDADSDEIVGPRIRRQKLLISSPPRTPSPHPPSRHEQLTDEELSQEEVRDITSSARKARVIQRMRSPQSRNKLKSEFQKNLESLRKKKQGLQSDSESHDESQSEDDSQDKRGLYDSASDVDSVGSDDFVVDEDMELTREELMEIPPEFTSVSYQVPKLNFKVVVQGEVYALLHPDYHGLDYTGTSLKQGDIIGGLLGDADYR
jgi:hypothetical protein